LTISEDEALTRIVGIKLSEADIPLLTRLAHDDVLYVVDASADASTASKKITALTIRQRYDVTMFGAAGDGVTDDTAAIQATIDLVEGLGGGEVFFPPGVYLYSSGLVVTKSHVVLTGSGKGITTLKTSPSFTTGVAISFTSLIEPHNSAPQHHAGLTNMSILSGSTNDTNTVLGLWIEDFHTSDFVNLYIQDFYQGVKCGCYMNYFQGVRVYGRDPDQSTYLGWGDFGWWFYGTPGTGPYPAQTIPIGCCSYYYEIGWKFTDCNTIQTILFDVENCTVGAYIGPNCHNIRLDGYWEALGTFFVIAGTGFSRNDMVMNIEFSGFWNPLEEEQGYLPTTIFGRMQYCRNIAFRHIHLRRSYDVPGDKFEIGPGVEDISIEGCNEEFDQLLAPNFVTSINGPLSRANLAVNGNFKRWSLGPTEPPDGWYIDDDVTTTVAQVADDKRDGDYVLKGKGNAAGDFTWMCIPIPVAFQKAGVTATLVADIKLMGSDPTAARLKLSPTNDNGILKGTEMSRNISNIEDESWPVVPADIWITRSFRPCIIGEDATQLRVRFYPDLTGSGHETCVARIAVYFGSTGWAFEETPFDTRAPVNIDITEMTYSEAGTSTTELGTWTMPSRTLQFGKYGLRIRAAGKITGTNGTKVVGIKIGATSIASISYSAGETDYWSLEVSGYRRNSVVLACFVKVQKGTALTSAPYALITTPNLETQDNIISVYGTLAHANDTILKEIFMVELV